MTISLLTILEEAKKKIKKKKERVIEYEYGCLMIPIDVPEWGDILGAIDKVDIYDDDKKEYGLETAPHVTILYGIHLIPNIKEKAKEFIQGIKPMNIKLKDVSLFEMENKPYDVLKFDVDSNYLHTLNASARKKFEYTNEYEYHPHVTIAYVKKGVGNKYKDLLKEFVPVTMKIEKVKFSGALSTDVTTYNIGKQ